MDEQAFACDVDQDPALSDCFPAIANDVREAGIEEPEAVDRVIQAILDRTAAIYRDDGRLDAVQPFPLSTPLSCDAANEVDAYVKANGFELFLHGAFNC